MTESTTLTVDLTNCPANGLVISADNVRLDLGGHAITAAPHEPINCFGGGTPPGPCFGIDTNGHDDLTLTNGTISNFDTNVGGVVADASSGDRLTRLRTSGSTTGDMRVGDDSVVEFNRFSGFVSVGARSTVAFNVGGPDGHIIAFNGDHNLIERNIVPKLSLIFATDSTVRGNVLKDGSLILQSRSDANRVTGNLLVPGHISVIGSSNDLVSRNVIIGTPPLLNGILVGFDPARGSSFDNIVEDNFVADASNDGILIQGGLTALRTLVSGNITIGNEHDGIENVEPTTTLVNNVANHNANLGIESVAGAIDGGGNRAAGNGNPLECTNVVCAP